ncbi:MAG: DUF1045 domain-containing protein [Deltaproteobacteria bacterium]|jgi:hypothetical protein|nr:DUF1045 domain-containing protein [Deltaproteobacteria bacterium]
MSYRYAIYYVPKMESQLYKLGRQALGYCLYLGRPYPSASAPTEKAAVYGFHATIIAPFRTASSRQDITDILSSASKLLFPVNLTGLKLVGLSPGFPALAIDAGNYKLAVLERTLLELLTEVRLPPTEDEINKRGILTARQMEYVQKWGYPWVLEEFRFHLTLGDIVTDPIELKKKIATLSVIFTPKVLTSVVLDSLALCVQDKPKSYFRLDSVYELKG